VPEADREPAFFAGERLEMPDRNDRFSPIPLLLASPIEIGAQYRPDF